LRVLLDESLPRGLAALILGHDVSTVSAEGWAGLDNGSLLTEASTKFDAFVTIDANLPYQQTLERHDIGVVLVRAPTNRIADLEPLVPALVEALDGINPGELRRVGA
jgi:hypothetical protein